jgi:hypothetical protein
MTEEKKKNLTVRIDEKVIEKAKELGLNLSALTESILKTASLSENKGIAKTSEVRENYVKIFIKIIDIMREWGTTYFLKIAEYDEIAETCDRDRKYTAFEMTHHYYLNPNGVIEHHIYDIEQIVDKWRLNEDWPVQNILKSDKLISNLIELLYQRAKDNKEKLKDIEILKNILNKLDSYSNEEKSKKKSVKDGEI